MQLTHIQRKVFLPVMMVCVVEINSNYPTIIRSVIKIFVSNCLHDDDDDDILI